MPCPERGSKLWLLVREQSPHALPFLLVFCLFVCLFVLRTLRICSQQCLVSTSVLSAMLTVLDARCPAFLHHMTETLCPCPMSSYPPQTPPLILFSASMKQ